jgi:hypothetical protein
MTALAFDGSVVASADLADNRQAKRIESQSVESA